MFTLTIWFKPATRVVYLRTYRGYYLNQELKLHNILSKNSCHSFDSQCALGGDKRTKLIFRICQRLEGGAGGLLQWRHKKKLKVDEEEEEDVQVCHKTIGVHKLLARNHSDKSLICHILDASRPAMELDLPRIRPAAGLECNYTYTLLAALDKKYRAYMSSSQVDVKFSWISRRYTSRSISNFYVHTVLFFNPEPPIPIGVVGPHVSSFLQAPTYLPDGP